MHIPRPSRAMVVACTALGVALGGTATAARTLVTGADIAPGAVTARQLAPGAVTAPKIANGAIGRAKLAPSARPVQVASISGPQGPAGPAGPAGPVGPPGAPGGLDPSRLSTVRGPDVLVLSGAVASAQAFCPAGQRATGGGFFSSIATTAASVPGSVSWGVVVSNDTFIDVTINAYVVCVAP